MVGCVVSRISLFFTQCSTLPAAFRTRLAILCRVFPALLCTPFTNYRAEVHVVLGPVAVPDKCLHGEFTHFHTLYATAGAIVMACLPGHFIEANGTVTNTLDTGLYAILVLHGGG